MGIEGEYAMTMTSLMVYAGALTLAAATPGPAIVSIIATAMTKVWKAASGLALGVAIGDAVDIEVARDDRPRVIELAPELEAALAAEPELRARFEALSFTRRRELADPVAEARKPETRAARIERSLARLRELA